MITNKELTYIILAYRKGNVSESLFHKCFSKIAETVYSNPSYYFPAEDVNDIINEAANLCVIKSDKFDVDRGKAYSFFITIIGCYLRQVWGVRKHAKKIGNT